MNSSVQAGRANIVPKAVKYLNTARMIFKYVIEAHAKIPDVPVKIKRRVVRLTPPPEYGPSLK